MSSTQISDYQKFENVYENFGTSLNKIKDIFDKQNAIIESINETEIWTSETQKELCAKYDLLKGNYDTIETSINSFISFMRKTLSDYKALNNSNITVADSKSNELDVS